MYSPVYSHIVAAFIYSHGFGHGDDRPLMDTWAYSAKHSHIHMDINSPEPSFSSSFSFLILFMEVNYNTLLYTVLWNSAFWLVRGCWYISWAVKKIIDVLRRFSLFTSQVKVLTLVATYGAACFWPMEATRLETLMMLPWVFLKYGRANWSAQTQQETKT